MKYVLKESSSIVSSLGLVLSHVMIFAVQPYILLPCIEHLYMHYTIAYT